MQTKQISLPRRGKIGPGRPCFVVAEIGNNHQGKFDLAREMVLSAAEAGVDGVKFQKRDIQSLLTAEGQNAPYIGQNSFGLTYGEHRQALELEVQEMAKLKELAHRLGLVFFASAWDETSANQMQKIGWDMAKICSADLVNVPLLRRVGKMGIPVVLSTGMSDWAEIDHAVAELKHFHSRIILLHCNSSYPCPPKDIGLPVMDMLWERYGLPVGYSGHEHGFAPTLAAVARGACIVERHFTMNKNLPGTDHQVSLEPEELRSLTAMIREVEKSMQVRDKMVSEKEAAAALKLRKSIVAARDIEAGHRLTEKDLTVKSPGTGMSPLKWDEVVGKKTRVQIPRDRQLSPELIR
ncbi:MAG: N-acetylneuraminate synthase family protein [Desulfonatronovibrionaceae bacterium]